MPEPEIDDLSIRRLAEASAWRVALYDAEIETSAAFEAWLASDVGNAAAWRQVTSSWDRFSAANLEPEFLLARRDALEQSRRHGRRRFGRRRPIPARLRVAAVLVASVSLATAGALGAWLTSSGQTYRTALGERSAVVLADGSRVELDSNSLLKVQLGRRVRDLTLLRGQADFQVAHDVGRPFLVRAGRDTVLATGTNFNVDLFDRRVFVTLIRGRVTILQNRRGFSALSGGPRPKLVVARLTPDEQFAAPIEAVQSGEASSAAPVVAHVNPERAMAWENGQLVFDNEPLSSAAARVARYGDQPIQVAASAAGLRLSGVFNTGDVAAFMDGIQHALPVTCETGSDGVIHVRRTGA